MNKLRIISILFILLFIFQSIICPTIARAEDMGEVISGADDFLRQGSSEAVSVIGNSENHFRENINDIFNIAFIIGVALTVIIGGILGIQFMVASADGKAKIKEALVPYIIGCVVIYGAFGIWKIVVTIGNQIS